MNQERRDAELREELDAHIRMAIQDRVERGEDPKSAEMAVRREFGNQLLVQETARDTWGWRWIEALLQDVRYALRMMKKSPGFTSVAVISLALGIGANTAIFSLVHTLILRALPVRAPHELVELVSVYPNEPVSNGFSWRFYEYFVAHNTAFSSLGAISQPWSARFSTKGNSGSAAADADPVSGQYVSGNLFQDLGVGVAAGRLIAPEEGRIGSQHSTVAVLSWSFWDRRFQRDPAILGKEITLDDVPMTVIGVTAKPFERLQAGILADVWVPVAAEEVMRSPSQVTSGRLGVGVIGRLKPGVSIQQARTDVEMLNRWRVEEILKTSKDPQMRQIRMDARPAAAGFGGVRDKFAKPLLALLSIVALLLLLACINVAGMLLARGAAREREMALRVSLGAGRWRLVRQALTESLLLATLGTAAGLGIAVFAIDVLVNIMTSGRDKMSLSVHLDTNILLFTAVCGLLTGVLFGLTPALRAFATAPASSLHDAGRGGETVFRRWFGKGLVAAQVALSFVMLWAASLFVEQLSSLRNLNLGFDRESILLMSLDPVKGGYRRNQLAQPYQELLTRLEAIPGVRSASLSAVTPISGAGASRMATVEGFQEDPSKRRYLSMNWVAPKYFQTLGTPLLAGREFTYQDSERGRVAIINRNVARYYFGDRSPLGRYISIDGDEKPYEIVGVVGEAKYSDLREQPARNIYFNAFQEGRIFSEFILRTTVAPESVTNDATRTVREVMPNMPVRKVSTLARQIDASIVPERLVALLSGYFGALGCVLAAIGLYGLLAFTVARRVNEIGIRMALGASSQDVVRMVLHEALTVVGAGFAVAIPTVLAARTVAASMIQGVSVSAALPMTVAAAGMLAIAAIAAYVPVGRAARVDPVQALRHE